MKLKISIGLNLVLLVTVVVLAVQNIVLRIDQAVAAFYAQQGAQAFGGKWLAPDLTLLGRQPYDGVRVAPGDQPGVGLEWLPPNLSVLNPQAYEPAAPERREVRPEPAVKPRP